MDSVFEAVNICLEKYIGREVFFDELDKMVKFDKEILKDFIKTVQQKYLHNNYEYIASGQFALCLHNYKLPVDIIVEGGIRKGKDILDLSPFVLKNKEYVFLDDSYFSGKTAQVIKEAIESNGGIFKGCYVVYDGSQNPIHKVDSIYRYYNHYDILGRKTKWKLL